MMTPREFIIEKLNRIHSLMEGIGFRYAYDVEINYHVIEVFPVNLYDSNEKYIELEIDFKERFYEMFPSENIVVSTDREIHDMSNLIYNVYPESKIYFNMGVQDDYDFDNILFSSCKKNCVIKLAA